MRRMMWRRMGTLLLLGLGATALCCRPTPEIPDHPLPVPPGQAVFGREKPIPEHQFMLGTTRFDRVDCSKCHQDQWKFFKGLNVQGLSGQASKHTFKSSCQTCHENVIYDFRLEAVTHSCNTEACHGSKPITDPSAVVRRIQGEIRTRLENVQKALDERGKEVFKDKGAELEMIRNNLVLLVRDRSSGFHNYGMADAILAYAEKRLGVSPGKKK